MAYHESQSIEPFVYTIQSLASPGIHQIPCFPKKWYTVLVNSVSDSVLVCSTYKSISWTSSCELVSKLTWKFRTTWKGFSSPDTAFRERLDSFCLVCFLPDLYWTLLSHILHEKCLESVEMKSANFFFISPHVAIVAKTVVKSPSLYSVTYAVNGSIVNVKTLPWKSTFS